MEIFRLSFQSLLYQKLQTLRFYRATAKLPRWSRFSGARLRFVYDQTRLQLDVAGREGGNTSFPVTVPKTPPGSAAVTLCLVLAVFSPWKLPEIILLGIERRVEFSMQQFLRCQDRLTSDFEHQLISGPHALPGVSMWRKLLRSQTKSQPGRAVHLSAVTYHQSLMRPTAPLRGWLSSQVAYLEI